MEIQSIKQTEPIPKIKPIEAVETEIKKDDKPKDSFSPKEDFISKETSFSFDDETKELIIRVKLGDVLNQFPSDEFLRIKKWLISQKDDII